MKSIVFDIGGVIFPDIWETFFFDDKEGILNLNVKEKTLVEQKLKKIWAKYAIVSSKGNDWRQLEVLYWSEVIKELAIEIPIEDLVKKSIEIIQPFAQVEDAIQSKIYDYQKVGICSNQTAFWFERQLQVSKVLSAIPRNHMVLSFECGFTKDTHPYRMFQLVNSKFLDDKKNIKYIDDRMSNVKRAKEFGFDAIEFLYKNENSIVELNKILKINSHY